MIDIILAVLLCVAIGAFSAFVIVASIWLLHEIFEDKKK